jgi:cytochrome c oxidase subunit II
MMPHADVIQSVLAPAGSHSYAISRLWWLMFWVATVVFVVAMSFVVAGLLRGLRRSRNETAITPTPRALDRWVGGAVALTVVILFALLAVSVLTGRTVASVQASSAVTISVIGHQWWWEVQYEDAVPDRQVLTANELHVPINRPIALKVTSRDVIHSFWAPNLQGKRDLIPGYTTAIWMEADHPGIFRGQCAEFCGMQHAHMAFDIVAESEEAFEHWLDGMREPAADPQSTVERHGRDLFMSTRCAGCHTVRGTPARGQLAPDLTHMATRSTLGAGTLPNTPEHLASWIRDPQASKPGNQMPPNPLSADDIQALVAYLGTLR